MGGKQGIVRCARARAKFYAWNKIRMNIALRSSTKWYKVLRDRAHGVKMRPSPVAYLHHKSDRENGNILEYMEQAGFRLVDR